MKRTPTWIIAVAVALLARSVAADVPNLLNYQGRLTDPSGNPKNGTFTMQFAMYDAETGGNQLPTGSPWGETQSVTVTNGVFNVLLGSVTALPAGLFQGGPSDASGPLRFLQVMVDGEVLAPRHRIASAGYAITGAANIDLPNSTATVGNILKGGVRFVHNFGSANTFVGAGAGNFAMTGISNTALGENAFVDNTAGISNTAIGRDAMRHNTSGTLNTAIGVMALVANTTGSGNIAVGSGAGNNRTVGDSNIDIGHGGIDGDSGVIRIGQQGTHTTFFAAGIRGVTTALGNGVAVLIDGNGQLGTISSSRNLKRDIEDMGDASQGLMRLRPVIFRYKAELDPSRTRQYGLIAEEVAGVIPDLVVYDTAGEPETVRYHLLVPMLLNEVQKEARQIGRQRQQLEEQQTRLTEQARQIKEQAQRIEVLAARLVQVEAVLGARGREPAVETSYSGPRGF
ncbi:MAG: tail fiber domain-containing protein [Deltaproteobacteria bacterium]|nr:tail fiber domain-containing protein [Deltaproteobacteria bacterium]